MLLQILLAALTLLGSCRAAVNLQIYNKEYVKICCGEPCQWLTFLVNRTLPALLLHSGSFVAQSRTYYHSPGGLMDSEYFQLGSTRYNFHVYAVPQQTNFQTKDSLPIDGTLGLGNNSPLWEQWDNYTLSSQRLVLGKYDYYSQFLHNQRPPVINLDEMTYVTLGDKTKLPIDFSIYSVETYLPYPLNISLALDTVKLETDDCNSQYSLMSLSDSGNFKCVNANSLKPNHLQSIELANGEEYSAVKYTSQHVFIPGARFFTEFFWFKNIVTNQLIITQDAFCMDYNSVTGYASIFITLSLGFWCHIAQSKTERKDNFEFFFSQMAEATCYLLNWIVLWVMFGMLNWSRYLTHYTSTESHFGEVFIMVMCALSAINWLYGLYKVPDYTSYNKRFKRVGLFHAMLLVTSQLLIVWLCFIKQHETSFDRLAAALVLNVAMILQLIVCLWFFTSENYIYFGITLAIAATTNVFNILYSIEPIFRYSDFQNEFASFCVVWIYFLEILPAMIIFTSAFSLKYAPPPKT
jgi:hypothetical protein